MWNESFFSAPQLKRDSLGGGYPTINGTPAQSGYFRKLAILLLRIIAIGYAIQGLCMLFSVVGWWSETWESWFRPVLYLVTAVALWVFTPRIALIAARGLDE